MSTHRIIPLVFAAVLTLYPVSAPAGVFREACAWLLGQQTTAPKAAAPAINLSPEELAVLYAWNKETDICGGLYCRYLTEEENLLLLGDLPEPIRAVLFARPTEVRARLDVLKLDPYTCSPLHSVLEAYDDDRLNKKDAKSYQALEARIYKIGLLETDKVAAIRQEILLKREVQHAKERLEKRDNPEYRIRFDGDDLIVPDGKRYRFTRTWGGPLMIWVRYGDILRTQYYESGEVIRKYIQDPNLGRNGFEGNLGPDGRFEIFDQHHRTRAYALKHAKTYKELDDTLIPMLVPRAKDGHYYTAPHWNVLSSGHIVKVMDKSRKWINDKTWSFLDAAARDQIIEASKISPINAIREIYYRDTELPRLP